MNAPVTDVMAASPLRRLGAFLADGFVFGAAGLVLDLVGLGGWPLAVVGVAYFIVGIAVWGQTVGKRFVGIRVVQAGTDRPPGWWRSTLRWALPTVPLVLAADATGAASAVNLVPVAIYLPVLFDPQRRGLHDRLAGTVVVDAG